MEEGNERKCTKEFMKPSFLKRFIKVYRSFPCLWKIACDEYSNPVIKANAYENLIELCKEVNPNANVDWVKHRIKNLRTVFRKEMKKIETSKKSGAGTDVYKPTLWYFNLLLFSADQELPRQSFSSMDTEDGGDMESDNTTGTEQVPH